MASHCPLGDDCRPGCPLRRISVLPDEIFDALAQDSAVIAECFKTGVVCRTVDPHAPAIAASYSVDIVGDHAP